MNRTSMAEFAPMGQPKLAPDPGEFTEICTVLPAEPPNQAKVCWVIAV